jgi:SAM-dependent methyltransferase
MDSIPDSWSAGTTYEDFMGRWSRELARLFVLWLDVGSGLHWLDVGCGTGALTAAICETADPASVMGCDPSESFVEFARENQRDERASFSVARAGSLPKRVDGYGSITSSLALNFFPEPESAIKDMCRSAAPRANISACVWDYSGGMQFLRYFWDQVSSFDSAASDLDEGKRFPICRPEPLEKLFLNAGLGDVRCEPIEIITQFVDFDDYWRPFLGGTGPAPSYIAALSDAKRSEFSRDLDRRLPKQPDGSITLTARAWAVSGTLA